MTEEEDLHADRRADAASHQTAVPRVDLGVEISEATPERVVATMLVRPDLCTAGGVCHGGAFMAFADTIGAVGTVMNLPPGTRTTTIESKTNFLGAALVNTRVTAELTPLHRGKTTQVWQTMIRSEAGSSAPSLRRRRWCCRPKHGPTGAGNRSRSPPALAARTRGKACRSRVRRCRTLRV